MIRLIRLELTRLLDWKRWLFIMLVMVLVGAVVAYQLSNEVQPAGIHINQWDIPLEVLDNALLVTLLLVPAFVGIVGDVVLRDRWSGFSVLSLPRIRSRARWWGGKLGALLVASLLYFVGVVVVVFVSAIPFTGVGWSLSEYGRTSPQELVQSNISKSYSPPPLPSVPIIGIALMALYAAVATFALVAVLLALAQWWPRAWVPLGLTLGVCLIFFRTTPTNGLHPLVHLFWDYHNFSDRVYAVEWWASGLVIGVELVAAYLLGTYILQTQDL